MPLINTDSNRFIDEFQNSDNDIQIDIATQSLSMYALHELQTKLTKTKKFRFIFTQPTFIEPKNENKTLKSLRLQREASTLGNKSEQNMRTNFQQKIIAQEIVEWLKQENVDFKSYTASKIITGFANLNKQTYYPINGFSTTDLGLNKGNYYFNLINKMDNEDSKKFNQLFSELWKDKNTKTVKEELIKYLENAYKDNSPDYIYYLTLFNIFKDTLDEEELIQNVTGFKDSQIWNKLYDFQKEGVLAILSKLNKYNGCILADSVGLGKTFSALAVIKYYNCKNLRCLVLCPKRLSDNWTNYNQNYDTNPFLQDQLQYHVLYHTDLIRETGTTELGINLETFNWSNYDLVVIDESHNFRNGSNTAKYSNLMDKVLKNGHTKVLMLSATPINNQFLDLKNQLLLTSGGNETLLQQRLEINTTIEGLFNSLQRRYNNLIGSKNRYADVANMLNSYPDFYEVLDKMTIARSRRLIEKYYNNKDIGSFPTRNSPLSYTPSISKKNTISYDALVHQLEDLNFMVYNPTANIKENAREKYKELFNNTINNGLTQVNREIGLKKLMAVNLLKRMESSVSSFNVTIGKLYTKLNTTIDLINNFLRNSQNINVSVSINEEEKDFDEMDFEEYFDSVSINQNIEINLKDIDCELWLEQLNHDLKIINNISNKSLTIDSSDDGKLAQLLEIVENKITHPTKDKYGNENKKVLIFTAFADTATYLYEQISTYMKDKYGVNTALVTGGNKCTSTLSNIRNNYNHLLTYFSPISKERKETDKDKTIDILIATDCVSEGQNLQDCDLLINYDIHWNPVRIIQRFGRIDRIGSINNNIQMVNFWPEENLDHYINLKQRVINRMLVVNLTAAGDDNIFNEKQASNEYRAEQIRKLKTEVVDMEDVQEGISILDLGFNEFKLDLLHYQQTKKYEGYGDLLGLYSVLNSNTKYPKGIVFLLKNESSNNINKNNPINPYYLVYVSEDGSIKYNFKNSKEILTILRELAKNKDEVDKKLVNLVNNEQDNSKLTKSLNNAVDNIKNLLNSGLIDNLTHRGGIQINNEFSDFDVISYFFIY